MVYKYINDIEHIERIIDRFHEIVSKLSGQEGKKVSFSEGYLASPYHEGYKEGVYVRACDVLDINHWKRSAASYRSISASAVDAMYVPNNNFVDYRSKDDFKKKVKSDPVETGKAIYDLFKTDNDAASLEALVKLFGRRYDMLSYLFFLKDANNYFPCAPKNFRQSFTLLEMNTDCFKSFTYDHYCAYNDALKELANLYSNYYDQIGTLDAHSFAWMIYKYPVINNYIFKLNHDPGGEEGKKEGIATTKTRLNQTEFRKKVVDYWGGMCAVTGCSVTVILEAAHIKGWKDCKTNSECISEYNGLLLTPNLHELFDSYLITFGKDGKIIISNKLSKEDRGILGLNFEMKLRKVDPEREKYMQFHRATFLKYNNA